MVVQVQEATPWVLIGVFVTALMGALQLPLESLKSALDVMLQPGWMLSGWLTGSMSEWLAHWLAITG